MEDVDIFKVALEDIEIPYILRHAENGDVLFVLLKERVPYILFLDIHMPCKDDMACIVEIRKNRQYDQLVQTRTENGYKNMQKLIVQ